MKNELTINEDIIFLNNDKTFLFPVIHDSPIIASLLRKSILKYSPDIIVVEQSSLLKDVILNAVSRLPFISVVKESFGENISYTLIHPAEAIFEGIRSGIENNKEIVFADYPLDIQIEDSDDSYFSSLIYENFNLKDFWKIGLDIASKREIKSDKIREEYFGNILFNLCKNKDKKVMAIFGMSHLTGIVENFVENTTKYIDDSISMKNREFFLLHPDSYPEILEPSAFIIQCYEESRENFSFNDSFFKLFKSVEDKYQEELKTSITLPRKNLFFKFSYKLALQNNSLLPSSLDMLESARSCVDDDFSFHWYNIAGSYKFTPPDGNFFLRLKPEDFGNRTISFRFRTKIKNKKRKIFRPILQSNKKDIKKWQEDWKNKTEGYCSFQPEDIFLEGYSEKIKKKVANISESKNVITHPFVGSLLDGIDLRETLKNFHTKRIYVKDSPKIGGDVDAVVFIFTHEDEDKENQFTYKMTWWGENDQESDMSFYATPPGINIISEGISRCEYGGFLLFYPRYSLSDIWADGDYHSMKSDEALITAAIDHSVTGNIVVISTKPPNHKLKSWAKRCGKKLIFIPVGSLSPSKIRRLRIFHILQGHKTRLTASEFIDDPNKWDNTDL
ncbi:MAG TPA: hypothetical protein PK771_04795 [Spirochaetota bacterium]|nr:hypothetical protein [Spirochaetota bacterium]